MADEQNDDLNSATQRHWMYGFNAGLMVVIGVVILGFVLIICEMTKDQAWSHWDWSSSGANSLSGSSRNLTKEINSKKQEYTLLSLFAGPNDEERKRGDPLHRAEQRRQVNDLLQAYARQSGNIKVEDQADAAREDVEKRVREKYQTELKPYQKAVDDFGPFATKLGKFLEDEQAAVAAYAQRPGAAASDLEDAAGIQASFKKEIDQLDSDKQYIRHSADSVLPQWNDIVGEIKKPMSEEYLPMFQLLSDPDKLKEMKFPLQSYFISATAKYKDMADQVTAYQDQLTKLPALKVDDVLSGLRGNCVVVLGPDNAKVLSKWDIYDDAPSNGNPDSDTPPIFKGEEAISSALLAMSRPEKVKVVFVTAAPGGMAREYSDTRTILEQANFEVLEWSPPSATPGGPPPDQTDPPAQGRGVVWVVFPPDPPNQQMAMMGQPPPNPGPVIEAARRHLNAGGSALFLAEKSDAGPMAMMGGGGGAYPYAELVADFGIDVKSKYSVVNQIEGQDRATGNPVTQLAPYWVIDHYPDNEITHPIESLPTAFYPSEKVTVVDVLNPAPAGTEAQVVIRTPGSSDYWAESNFSPKAEFDKDADLRAPVPVAVAAIKNKGKKDAQGDSTEQRVVVIGSTTIGSNTILRVPQMALIGSRVVEVPRFPGNSELMRNTMLWVAGYENMIAVSSKATIAKRISGVSPVQLGLVRGSVIAGIPLLALLFGGIMWMVRRR